MDFVLRPATSADAPALEHLISRSVRALLAEDYTPAQLDAAIGSVFLVDPGLIADGTYLVAEATDGRLAGAGGWSTRRALHGGYVLGDTGERVDPTVDPARIRAYFVDPDFARRGVGARLLGACEAAARAAGFAHAVLGATLAGARLYASQGYAEGEREETPLPGGLTLTLVHMRKRLG